MAVGFQFRESFASLLAGEHRFVAARSGLGGDYFGLRRPGGSSTSEGWTVAEPAAAPETNDLSSQVIGVEYSLDEFASIHAFHRSASVLRRYCLGRFVPSFRLLWPGANGRFDRLSRDRICRRLRIHRRSALSSQIRAGLSRSLPAQRRWTRRLDCLVCSRLIHRPLAGFPAPCFLTETCNQPTKLTTSRPTTSFT